MFNKLNVERKVKSNKITSPVPQVISWRGSCPDRTGRPLPLPSPSSPTSPA